MRGLTNLGLSSNEKREQNIIRLQNGFHDEQFNTIQEASTALGFAYETVKKWAIDGNIPLLDKYGNHVVPLTASNARKVNYNRQEQHIKHLRTLFDSQKAVTIRSASKLMGYPENTVIFWALKGDIPLLSSTNTPVVQVHNGNRPKWLKA